MNKPRLTDANELIEWLTKPTGFRTNCEDCPATGCIDCIIEEAIKNTPTAYDIQGVVERLEEERDRPFADCDLTINGRPANDREITACKVGINYAIEIVKGGAE